MFEKIWINFKNLLNSKKFFTFPEKNPIIIYDDINSDLIEELLLKNKKYTILHVHKIIYIPILLLSFIYIKNLRYAYQIAFLKYTNAKYVINYHDDSIKISIPCKVTGCKLILIQNGLRDADCFINLDNRVWEADYYFVHNRNWKDWISKKVKAKYIISGSIKNNFFPKASFKKIKNVLWISHFTENKVVPAKFKKSRKEVTWKQDIYETNRICIEVLKNFCKKYKLNLEVLSAYKENSIEEKLFYQSFGVKIKEVPNDNMYPWREAYNNISSDTIIVHSTSTLGYELFSRNYRVAFFPIRSQLLNIDSLKFAWPRKTSDVGNFWCNNNDSNSMTKVMEFLLNVSEEEWLKEISYFEDIMKYDYNNEIIQLALKEEGLF